MLVITRRVEESITVGDIVIKIVEVKGKQVRVGILAPKEVKILRNDFYKRQVVLTVKPE
jgi:carbon storage regulator